MKPMKIERVLRGKYDFINIETERNSTDEIGNFRRFGQNLHHYFFKNFGNLF